MLRSGFAAVALALLASIGVGAQPTQIELWSNNAVSRLASGVTAAATTFVVEAGHGARFPSPGAGQYFWATVQSGSTLEIVQCTARSTDTMTCTRAQQGTAASAFSTGATFENRITRDTLRGLWAGWNLIEDPDPDRVRLTDGLFTAYPVTTVTATGNVTSPFELADGTITRTLPAASTCTGCLMTMRNIGTGIVTMASAGGAISGPTLALPGVSRNYLSNGTDWYEVSGNPHRRVSGATGVAGAEVTYQRLTASQAVTAASLTTVMTTTGLSAGHWTFNYQVIFQSAATTTGMGVGVNHTGTTSHFLMFCHYPTSGGAAANNTHDSVTSTVGGQLVEAKAERVKNTSSSASVGVADANADQIVICNGTVTASTTGDLELRVLTEVANSAITVQPNTSLKLEKVGQ